MLMHLEQYRTKVWFMLYNIRLMVKCYILAMVLVGDTNKKLCWQ